MVLSIVVLLAFFSWSGSEAATEDFAAQFSVISARTANGNLVSRFSVSQKVTQLKEGYEISVTHDTKPCKNYQESTFSVQLKAPRRPTQRYRLFTYDVSWNETLTFCRQDRLRLADPPETSEDMEALKCSVARGNVGKKYVALGFHYDAVKKSAVNSDEQPLDTSSSVSSLHKSKHHTCGAMDAQGKLQYVHCGDKMYYMCQEE